MSHTVSLDLVSTGGLLVDGVETLEQYRQDLPSEQDALRTVCINNNHTRIITLKGRSS